MKEYEIVKKFKGECRYYIEAETEEEALQKAESMPVMNASVQEINSIECEGEEDL